MSKQSDVDEFPYQNGVQNSGGERMNITSLEFLAIQSGDELDQSHLMERRHI